MPGAAEGRWRGSITRNYELYLQPLQRFSGSPPPGRFLSGDNQFVPGNSHSINRLQQTKPKVPNEANPINGHCRATPTRSSRHNRCPTATRLSYNGVTAAAVVCSVPPKTSSPGPDHV